MKTRAHRRHGLTLPEVLLVVATVALLILFLLPSLARTHVRRSRVGCTSQLQCIGLAFRLFSNDHNDKFVFAVSAAENGSKEFVNTPQVFRHFQALSNELVTPRILVCNSDADRPGAVDFLGGFNSNTQLSYFVGLDADESKPERILSGDRNIEGGTLSNGFLRLLQPTSKAGWSRAMHHNQGNVALADGNAMQMNAARLRQQLATNSALSIIRLAIP